MYSRLGGNIKCFTFLTCQHCLRKFPIQPRLKFLLNCFNRCPFSFFLQIKILRHRHRCQNPQQHKHHHNFNERKTLLPKIEWVSLDRHFLLRPLSILVLGGRTIPYLRDSCNSKYKPSYSLILNKKLFNFSPDTSALIISVSAKKSPIDSHRKEGRKLKLSACSTTPVPSSRRGHRAIHLSLKVVDDRSPHAHLPLKDRNSITSSLTSSEHLISRQRSKGNPEFLPPFLRTICA